MPNRTSPSTRRKRLLLVAAAVVVLVGAALGGLALSSTGGQRSPGASSQSPSASAARPVIDQTPRQILAAATAAQAHVHGMHVRGAITAAGVGVTFALDVTGAGNGKGIFSERGTSITIVKSGSTLYLYAGLAFWEKNGDPLHAAALSDRWLDAPVGEADFTSLSQFFEPFRFTTQLYPAGSGAIRKGAPTTVSGQRAIPLTGAVTTGGITQTTTLYVAATGTPYVVEASASKGSEKAVIEFSKFGEKVTVKAPPHATGYATIVNPG
jgi:hypothetical protein